jgi:hypothetical protein
MLALFAVAPLFFSLMGSIAPCLCFLVATTTEQLDLYAWSISRHPHTFLSKCCLVRTPKSLS